VRFNEKNYGSIFNIKVVGAIFVSYITTLLVFMNVSVDLDAN